MPSHVRILNEEEKLFLFRLLDEFATKIQKSRKDSSESEFGHYGIVDMEDDSFGQMYTLNLPECYIGFFNYLLSRDRTSLVQ